MSVKNSKNRINIFLINHLEREGKEVKKIFQNSRLVQAIVTNPLDRLLKKGTLTKEEYYAAKDYGIKWELSNLTNHSRPSHEPISNIRHKEKTISQTQIAASRYVNGVKSRLEKEGNSLLKILELVFEKEKSINNAEAMLGLNHAIIEKRVKIICNFL